MGPCRTRPRQARPSRVAEGLGDAGFHVGTILLGRYVAVRRAKYPRRPRHGTSKRARRRARPRQARPSRVVEGVGDVGFHFGAVPPGRYAARRRGTSKQARRRARPRQARPSRVAEVQETRDFTSEQFRSEIPYPQTHGGSVAGLRSAQKDKERKCVYGGGGGDCGRGRRPRRPDPSAERCGAAHCVGSGGRAGRAPLPMSGHSIVRHARAIVRHIGAIVHQSQPTWEIRADVPRRG